MQKDKTLIRKSGMIGQSLDLDHQHQRLERLIQRLHKLLKKPPARKRAKEEAGQPGMSTEADARGSTSFAVRRKLNQQAMHQQAVRHRHRHRIRRQQRRDRLYIRCGLHQRLRHRMTSSFRLDMKWVLMVRHLNRHLRKWRRNPRSCRYGQHSLKQRATHNSIPAQGLIRLTKRRRQHQSGPS